MILGCIFFSLFIGIFIGILLIRYKDQKLLHNHRKMYDELQDHKMKLDEYRKELVDHFTYSIELLNKMADNYRNLYQNIKKSANFFLPNTHIQDNLYTLHTNKTNINEDSLPIKAPKDYSDEFDTINKK